MYRTMLFPVLVWILPWLPGLERCSLSRLKWLESMTQKKIAVSSILEFIMEKFQYFTSWCRNRTEKFMLQTSKNQYSFMKHECHILWHENNSYNVMIFRSIICLHRDYHSRDSACGSTSSPTPVKDSSRSSWGPWRWFWGWTSKPKKGQKKLFTRFYNVHIIIMVLTQSPYLSFSPEQQINPLILN